MSLSEFLKENFQVIFKKCIKVYLLTFFGALFIAQSIVYFRFFTGHLDKLYWIINVDTILVVLKMNFIIVMIVLYEAVVLWQKESNKK